MNNSQNIQQTKLFLVAKLKTMLFICAILFSVSSYAQKVAVHPTLQQLVVTAAASNLYHHPLVHTGNLR